MLPAAFAGLRLDGVDLVVSSTSAFAHHVRPRAARGTLPTSTRRPASSGRRTSTSADIEPRNGSCARRWPGSAAPIAPPSHGWTSWWRTRPILQTACRIHGRDAVVIHPPIDVAAFRPGVERSGRFLVVARLRPGSSASTSRSRRRRIGAGLDVIGSGPTWGASGDWPARTSGSSAPAGPEVSRAMAACDGLLVPGAEDFGLTLAEVQAAGRPPIAFAAGGALEIVDDGRTGFLASAQTVDAFAAAMLRAREIALDPDALSASAAGSTSPSSPPRCAR
jgi:hypothetical protein